ncbi:MAG TPA: hypothetical protein ENN92_00715, partial [candidate division WWE3 bacterium]|nr:hypothetical protein [candidate division WWE3 bacterium]
MKSKGLKILAATMLFSCVGFVAYLNLEKKAAINEARLPTKVSESRSFLRWITNLKNKDVEIEGKEFELIE